MPEDRRRIAGIDEAVISLNAKRITTGEIQNHIAEIYVQEIPRDLVSKVTDHVLTDMLYWQQRPLDPGRFLAVVANLREGDSHVPWRS